MVSNANGGWHHANSFSQSLALFPVFMSSKVNYLLATRQTQKIYTVTHYLNSKIYKKCSTICIFVFFRTVMERFLPISWWECCVE